MSNPTRSASVGHMPATGKKEAAVNKRPQYKSPTVLTYTDDRFRREMGLGQATKDLRPDNV